MEDVQSFRLMWKSRPKSIAAIVSKSFISKIPNNKTRNGREKRQNTKKKGKKGGKKETKDVMTGRASARQFRRNLQRIPCFNIPKASETNSPLFLRRLLNGFGASRVLNRWREKY